MDFFLGATALPDDDPRNRIHPGKFSYGGGHVIEELAAGKDVRLTAHAYGTDCYPRRKLETWIRLEDMNEAVLFNMRNAYQNYNVAVNLSDRVIYTYMGVLQPNMRNATYCSAGQLSPLLNDPLVPHHRHGHPHLPWRRHRLRGGSQAPSTIPRWLAPIAESPGWGPARWRSPAI